MVYLHKVTGMREGREPEQWPPDYDDDASALELIDDAYRQLIGEFASRDPGEATGTWYGPDQTVGFWIRRMAQETVIHRIDAELGAGVPVTAVPDDLAIDGIDELLKVFVAYSVREEPSSFTQVLVDSPGRTYEISTDSTADTASVSWRVRSAPGQFTVDGGPAEVLSSTDTPNATISGTPAAILRWAWNRDTPGDPIEVRVTGDLEALAEFRAVVAAATQ
jgi:uncharacterized protein (TIGR03083 family)